MVRGKSLLFLATILNIDLAVSAVSILRGIHRSIAKRANTFVHTWSWIKVVFVERAKFLILEAKSEGSVLIVDAYYVGCPFVPYRFNDVLGKHLPYIGLLALLDYRASPK